MNAQDRNMFNAALALAAEFGHGWVGFTDHAEGANTLDEAFERINEAMDAQSAAELAEWRSHSPNLHTPQIGDVGLRPSLKHTSWSGRLKWMITGSETVFRVMRPQGMAAYLLLYHETEDFKLRITDTAEGRHLEALRWGYEALGIDGFDAEIAYVATLAQLVDYAAVRGADTRPVITERIAALQAAEANREALRKMLDAYPAAAGKIKAQA